jgi:hypothetical protein
VRPTASASYAGCIRYNTQTYSFEGCSGLSPSWQAIGGSGEQWAVSGSDISFSTGLVSFGKGINGTATTFNGGPFFKQGAWTTSGTSHLIADFYGGDNSTGILYIYVKSITGKLGNLMISFMKQVDVDIDIFEISEHHNASIGTITTIATSNAINVGTDEGCSICWTSIGGC